MPRQSVRSATPAFLRIAALTLALASVLAGCATGKDAVSTDGVFQFVSPGGKTEILYNPPSKRGTISGLQGPELTDPSKTVSLSDYPGKVVVLNLWGSWCGPCRGEAEDLENTYTKMQASGVQFIGIDFRDDQSTAQDFVGDRKITYPSIFDPSGRSLLTVARNFPTSVVPATLILDRKHRVAAVYLKPLSEDVLLPALQRILAERDS